MHDSDFRIVKSKKNRSRKSYLIVQSGVEEGVLGDKLRHRLSEIETEITAEQFYPDLVQLLRNRTIDRVVCLGLGHFSTCTTARTQLAFLLALRTSLEDLKDIQLQDPAFTDQEVAFLRSLDFQVLLDNTEGRFSTSAGEQVLYYLPHCPKALTNNLLATNWTRKQLQNSVIVCNSFQALLVNTLERDIQAEAKYVKRISESTTEKELRVSERHFDSFNDTSIHLFESQNIDRITDPSFWVINDEEEKDSTDPELISIQLQKTLKIQ